MQRRKKSSITSGSSSGARSFRARRKFVACVSKKWNTAADVSGVTPTAVSVNSRTIESVAQRKHPCLELANPAASFSASIANIGAAAVLYDNIV